jgi:hypothetical protein
MASQRLLYGLVELLRVEKSCRATLRRINNIKYYDVVGLTLRFYIGAAVGYDELNARIL